MNYWEQRKSFWTQPAGIAIELLLILLLLGGAILALNIFTSPYPVIESLDASPVVVSPGGATVLSWSIVGATGVKIDPGIGMVALNGSRSISPGETTTFVLTAVNGTRSRSASVKVMVGTL